MDLGLAGRTAVVLASTGGLGLASARALGNEGANIVINGRRGELAVAVAAALPSAVGIGADLTDPDTPRRVMDAAQEVYGQVDILVWNSGGPPHGPATDIQAEDVSAAADLVLNPFLRLLDLALPPMRSRGWGRIVAIGSSGVEQPIPDLALSNILRPAVAGLCKTLSAEVAADGVTVNMVLPGRIATDRVAENDRHNAERLGLSVDEVEQRSRSLIPTGRYGRPEELGAVVAFLCSEPASYMTGSRVRVDGGYIRSH
jgi:3-oxoacyl-[acyl-carrier protein] reductase